MIFSLMLKTCFEILKVNQDVSFAEVKQAYRERVKFWHPDRFPAQSKRLQERAHEELKKINEAFKKLENHFNSPGANKTKHSTGPKKQKPSGKSSAENKKNEASSKPTWDGIERRRQPVKDRRILNDYPPSPIPPLKPKVQTTVIRPGHIIRTWPNGDRYEGQGQFSEMHGEGIYDYANGDLYMGEFKNGYPHGKGTFAFSEGAIYRGDFVNDEIEGHGVYYYPNGDTYTGEFKGGQPNGQGTYLTANGTECSGEWKNGSFLGS